MSDIRCQHGVRMTSPCVECGRKPHTVTAIDKGLPAVLLKHRTALRAMMQNRCAQPNCPIPPALANRAADWILMLCSFRANERRKLGKPAFPDQATLSDDIAKSAEAIEIVFITTVEDVTDSPVILTYQGAPVQAANDGTYQT